MLVFWLDAFGLWACECTVDRTLTFFSSLAGGWMDGYLGIMEFLAGCMTLALSMHATDRQGDKHDQRGWPSRYSHGILALRYILSFLFSLYINVFGLID